MNVQRHPDLAQGSLQLERPVVVAGRGIARHVEGEPEGLVQPRRQRQRCPQWRQRVGIPASLAGLVGGVRHLHISHLVNARSDGCLGAPGLVQRTCLRRQQRAILLRAQDNLHGFELPARRRDAHRVWLGLWLGGHGALAPDLPAALAPPHPQVFCLRQPVAAPGVAEDIIRGRPGQRPGSANENQ